MSDVPSWLQEEDTAKVAVKITNNPVARGAAVSAASNPAVQSAVLKAATAPAPPKHDIEAGRDSEFVIEEETLKQMRNWHLGLRVAYIGAAVFLAAAAALALTNQSDIGIVFFAFYVFFFACLLCCFEFALNMVSRLLAINFGFLYTLSGRWIFLLFVGFMSFSLGSIGIAAMCFLYLVGLFHVYIMWKFPRFEEYLRKKHYFQGTTQK